MKNINQVKQNLKADDFALADDEARNHFIDEAVEILQQMDVNLPKWSESPTDIGILASIRRGFRTLNSSSRNVGAHSVGEVAWSVESLLDAVVDADIEVSDVIVEFVTEAKYNIPYLINDFANDELPSIDIATLVLKSENLKSSHDINDGFEDDEDIDITKSTTDGSTTDDSTSTVSSESDTPDDKLTLNLSEGNSRDDKKEKEEREEDVEKDGEVSSTKFETPASMFDSSVLKKKSGLFSDQGFNEQGQDDDTDNQTDNEPKKVGSDTSNNAKESSEETADSNSDADKVNADADNESSNDDDNKDNDSKAKQETPTNELNDDVDNAEATDEKSEDEKADDKVSDVSEDDDDNGASNDKDEDLIAKTNSKLKKETKNARVENPDYKKSLSDVTLEQPKEISNSGNSKSLVWITIGVILFIVALGVYSTTL